MNNEPTTTDLVLLVEDNKVEIKIIRHALSGICEIVEATTIEEARLALKNHNFSLILLDAGLPDGCGFALCEEIRKSPVLQNTPIFFITGRSGIDDRVGGFTVGADDYIIKPIEPSEFAARVRSKLKRKSAVQKDFIRGRFHVNLMTQKISIVKEDGSKEPLELTPLESKIMIHFLQNEGQIFSRQDLMKAIWGESTHISAHTVDTHISSLRKKMGDFGTQIKSIQKQGYCYQNKTN